MGMFDHVAIPLEFLPVTSINLKLLQSKHAAWQTKSMDNLMVTYTITPKKELWLLDGDWETVPEEERPHPNATGLRGLIGSMRVVRDKHEKLDYTGTINFYGYIDHKNRKWFEFNSIFQRGNMIIIECVEQPGEFIDPAIKETFS